MTNRATALAVGATVLLGYIATLAPTVTFWDAGELIAAAHGLGIPHPPGTPLFVLLAHVWALLLPIGEYAARTNLFTASAGAAAAAIWFLVARDTTRRMVTELHRQPGQLLELGGAAAASLVGAFSFTNWRNSTETEVYAVACLTVSLLVWFALRWRERRSPSLLLLVVYLMALSVGNHLLALLAGPAVLVFLVSIVRAAPAADARTRASEWAHAAIVAGAWALVLGTGLGSARMFLFGIGVALATLVFAASRRELWFGLGALGLVAVGASVYVFLYLRAGQDPAINEAAPSTWRAFLDVVGRAQYPVRSPFDDPTLPHGPDNLGRSFSLLWFQLLNYVQYFDWQWARSLDGYARVAVTMLMASLGLRGLFVQRALDRPTWRLLLTLFLVTGLGLVGYMNFKPGFSLGLGEWPNRADHEVRERDYFFVLSFVVWGVWVGIGLTDIARRVALRLATRSVRVAAVAASAVLLLAFAPFGLNLGAASRRGSDARLAADTAYDLLNSVPPHGVLFTNGDNDTFPLWWAQEVEGIRADVTVVCLALAHTPWYARQLRDRPARRFDAASAPEPWRRAPAASPPADPLHTMTDAEIDAARPQRIDRALSVDLGPFQHIYPAGTVFYRGDIVTLRILQQNLGRRPVVWALTAARGFAGLGDYVVQQGLGFRVDTLPPDDADRRLFFGAGQPPLDIGLTRLLVDSVYRYAGLESNPATRPLEPTEAQMGRVLAVPLLRLAEAHRAAGDSGGALHYAERAMRLGKP